MYKRLNLREQDIYTHISPTEQTLIASQATTVPQELNFTIPNKHYANTIQSALTFNIGVAFTTGDLSAKTVIQTNGGIYVIPSANLPSTTGAVLKCRLPL